MQDFPAAICACGDQAANSLERCTTCFKNHKRLSQQKLPGQSNDDMTPPPSQPGSPQRRSSKVTAQSYFGAPRRTSRAAEAITSAFTNDDSEDELGTSAFIPASCYRTPTRSSSNGSSPRRQSPTTSDLPACRTPMTARDSQESIQTSGSTTPEVRPSTVEYAPMVAGSARLSLKNDSTSEQVMSRSTRESFALEAKLFSGPA